MPTFVHPSLKRQYLVLDLETVLDTSLPPPKKRKDGTESFPPPPYHKIVVMGAALLDAAYRLRSVWIVGEGRDEFAALTALVAFLAGPHSGFINGTDILIDGGAHVGMGFGIL